MLAIVAELQIAGYVFRLGPLLQPRGLLASRYVVRECASVGNLVRPSLGPRSLGPKRGEDDDCWPPKGPGGTGDRISNTRSSIFGCQSSPPSCCCRMTAVVFSRVPRPPTGAMLSRALGCAPSARYGFRRVSPTGPSMWERPWGGETNRLLSVGGDLCLSS